MYFGILKERETRWNKNLRSVNINIIRNKRHKSAVKSILEILTAFFISLPLPERGSADKRMEKCII